MHPDSLISLSQMTHGSKHRKMCYKIINHQIKLFRMWQIKKVEYSYLFQLKVCVFTEDSGEDIQRFHQIIT